VTRGTAAFVLGGFRVSCLLILHAHMFLVHVLHPHHTITTLFLVRPLNEERESQGTAANGTYCAVIDIGILSPPAESHPALDTQIPMLTVYSKTPVQKLQLSQTASRPHNLLFYNSNLSTLTLCSPTVISLHAPTYSQHVSLIMLSKPGHVATIVAIVNLLLGVELELRIQRPLQWNEGFECSLPQPSLTLQK
jgi:hypothetical protein